jgi:tripartite-type tricarboxylate transporter receptor subunit TctC
MNTICAPHASYRFEPERRSGLISPAKKQKGGSVKNSIIRRLLQAGLAVASVATAASAAAQGYPSKPIRVIVPFAAGGSADLTIRTATAKVAERIGQPFVIENRPGAAGQLGVDAVLSAPADGYTLLSTPSGAISVNVHLRKLPFDPATDLVPVTMLAKVPAAIAVNGQLPIHSIRDLLTFAETKADGVSYSTSSLGTHMHLTGVMLKAMTGGNFIPIPYRGTSPAATAIRAGDVPMGIADLTTLRPLAHDGGIRILAVVDPVRTATAPDIPTVAESGVPGYGASAWIGVFARAGTPPDIIAKLNEELTRAIKLPEVSKTYLAAGLEPMPMGLAEAAKFVRDDIALWGKLIKDNNIKAGD